MPEPGSHDPVMQIILNELRALRVDMNSSLNNFVSQDALARELRRADQHHTVLSKDIVDEEIARAKDVVKLNARQDGFAANLRWVFAAIVIPTAGLITTIVLTLQGRGT